MASIIKASINLNEIPKDKIYVGKKGKFTTSLKLLGDLPVETRPVVGEEINKAKSVFMKTVSLRKTELEAHALQ